MIIIARFKKPPCNFLPPLNIIRKSHNEEKFSPLSEIGSNFEIWCDKWPLPHLARCSIWFNTQGVCLREIDSTSKVLLFFASTLCCFTTLANNRNKLDCFTILQKKMEINLTVSQLCQQIEWNLALSRVCQKMGRNLSALP